MLVNPDPPILVTDATIATPYTRWSGSFFDILSKTRQCQASKLFDYICLSEFELPPKSFMDDCEGAVMVFPPVDWTEVKSLVFGEAP